MTVRTPALLPLLLVVALGIQANNCADAPMPDDPPIVQPGESFSMAVGDTVRVMVHDDLGGDLVFDRVAEDSRCPVDVECVWEGEARVNLTLFYADDTVHPVELTIPGMRLHGVTPEEARQALAGAFLVHLLRLDPYPGTQDNGPAEASGVFLLELIHR